MTSHPRKRWNSRMMMMKTASSQIVYAYWDRLRGERAAPERGEIEPGEIRGALADAFVLEMVDGRAVFRLAGTRMSALLGRELKSLALEDIWDESDVRDDLHRLLDMVMNETAGAVAGFIAETMDRERIHLELLLLPLRHRGRTHSRMMGALSPMTTPAWLGLKPVSGLRMVSVRMIWPTGGFGRLANAAARRAGFIVHEGGRERL